MFRLLALTLVLSSLLNILLLSNVYAGEQWQQPDFILNAFSEVALKNEYGPDDGRIKKWQAPINVWIDHQVGDQKLHEELLLWHINHLADITGHPMRLVKRRQQANVHFTYTQFEKMQQSARKQLGKKAETVLYSTLCLAQVTTGPNNQINQARIIIPVDQARMHGKLVSCIVEEMTQILGLVNDSNAVYPSIFNDRTPNELLSGLDYLLLKILYAPDMHAGMNKTTALNLARKVIDELIASGEASQASKTVSSGKLYEIMGYR